MIFSRQPRQCRKLPAEKFRISHFISASALAVTLGAAALWPDSDFASTAPSLARAQEDLVVRSAVKPSDEALSGMVPSLTLLEGTAKTQAAAEETPEVLTVEDDAVHEGSPRHLVAEYISRTFRIPMREARQITDWAVEIGEARDLDPLLILAVIGTESSFKPKARSHAGAEGLMQVMTSVHEAKFDAFGGREAAFDPYANMVVGTDILSYLIQRTGSVRRALKWYSGAANLDNDRGYGARVMREHSLLAVAAEGRTDAAVKLHRAGKSAKSDVGNAARLGFARWVKLSEQRGNAARARNAGMQGERPKAS